MVDGGCIGGRLGADLVRVRLLVPKASLSSPGAPIPTAWPAIARHWAEGRTASVDSVS